jgi:hypothetical protein
MPQAVMVAALPAAIMGVASVVGSKTQQSASRDAARIESSSTDKALAYQREQDAYDRKFKEDERDFDRGRYTEERDFDRGEMTSYRGRLSPYANAGVPALQGLSSHLSAPLPSMQHASSQMVKIQAPTGEVKDVPAQFADRLLAAGGKRVG